MLYDNDDNNDDETNFIQRGFTRKTSIQMCFIFSDMEI